MDATLTESERFLGDYLFSDSPCRLLIVGQLPDVLISQPAADVVVHRLNSLHDAEAMATKQAPHASPDTATHETLILQLDADSLHLQQHLGRAVRAFPHRVLVHVQVSDPQRAPADEIFYALGFRRLIVMPDNGKPACAVRWFEYRLSDYKASPEWLNARFWAHPERFSSDEDPDIYCDEEE